MQEYYKILNLSEDATDEEVELAYKTLKEKYSKDRFLEGDVGNRAAKNLTKLETAYEEIKISRAQKSDNGKSESLSEVERLIKAGDLSKAQNVLDDFSERGAEWHYLQSVLFYKKNWLNESKKQLEIAVNMDPSNEKYKDSYKKLTDKINYNNQQFNQTYNTDPNSQNTRQMGGSACGSFAECCTTWCCINMLCNGCR